MSPKLQRLHDAAKNALGPWVVSLQERLGELTLVVKAADYHEAARTLRDHPDLRFEQTVDLCGVDYSTYGDRAAGTGGASYAAVLHLLSFTHNWRLRLRCFAPDDAFPVLPSVVENQPPYCPPLPVTPAPLALAIASPYTPVTEPETEVAIPCTPAALIEVDEVLPETP